ncbi:hypothetical protein MXB_5028 [Myxobolus squamalis]|nr:hypothetical protein MXB_5028 [Myxobolus squamalis]
MKDIKAGEELTITYIDHAIPISLRQAELSQYQMTYTPSLILRCTCTKCTCPETELLRCLDPNSNFRYIITRAT